MKFSAIIISKRDAGIVFTLGLTLQERDLIPILFLSEGSGDATIATRILLDCDKGTMVSLVSRWHANAAVQSVVTDPCLIDPPLLAGPFRGQHA